MPDMKLGLCLSGGGSRAVAFHLGCLRALHDRGILTRVRALSSVSGGSIIAALYAYYDEPFDAFEQRVHAVLRCGFVWGIARHTLLTLETPRILATLLTAGVAAHAGMLVGVLAKLSAALGADAEAMQKLAQRAEAPLRRSHSRSTAFEHHLRSLYGETTISQVKRAGLDVVINAAELRTATAFRFGSQAAGSWRFGILDEYVPRVSEAVAASAAFPILLPAFDLELPFRKSGQVKRERVILTDGGVYDNLGITCLLPGRSSEHNINAFDIDFIICCDAGQGQPTGASIPYTWNARLAASFATTHRRTHSMSYDLLHRLAATGEIRGFLLPYLGQLDNKLPNAPADLVHRDAVFDYPTDFNPMSDASITRLGQRGEQLTHTLIELHYPSL